MLPTPGNLAETVKWEEALARAEGNFIEELPTYRKNDSAYDSVVTNGTDGSREVQAMRGVNIIRYQWMKKNLKVPMPDGSYPSIPKDKITTPAKKIQQTKRLKRFRFFRSSNHGAYFYGSEFGT